MTDAPQSRPAPCHPRWMRFAPALLAWIVLPLLILVLPRGFHGNDDTIMVEVLRSGHPAHFLGDVLALFLAFLYVHVSAHVPWYGLLLYAGLCASGHALGHVLWRVSTRDAPIPKLWRHGAMLVLVAVLWALSSHITFTIVSILACGAGLVSFAACCRDDRPSMAGALACGGLLALGYLLRTDGLLAALVGIGIPGLLFCVWLMVRRNKAHALALILFMAPIAAVIGVSKWAPSELSQAELVYRQYNATRGGVQGFERYEALIERNPGALEAAGWSPWEYEAFMRFMNFDEDRFPLAKIQTLYGIGKSYDGPWGQDIRHGLRMCVYMFPVLILALGSVFLLATWRTGADWRSGGLLLLHGIYLLCIITIMTRVYRTVPRVMLPMLCVGTVSALLAAWWMMGSAWLAMPLVGWRRVLGVSAALVLGVWAAARWWDFEGSYPHMWRKQGDFAATLRREVPGIENKVLVEYQCMSAMAEGVDPLFSVDPMPFRIIFLEWDPPSPHFYECLSQAGISRGADIMSAALARDDVFFLVAEDQAISIDIYAQFSLRRTVHLERVKPLSWPNTGLFRLRDGPSQRLRDRGVSSGSLIKSSVRPR